MADMKAKLQAVARQRLLREMTPFLLDGEQILCVTSCADSVPVCQYAVATTYRVFGWRKPQGVAFELVFHDDVTTTPYPDHETIVVASSAGTAHFRMVPADDIEPFTQAARQAATNADRATIRQLHEQFHSSRQAAREEQVRAAEQRMQNYRSAQAAKLDRKAGVVPGQVVSPVGTSTGLKDFPGTQVKASGRLTNKASAAIRRQCHGDSPWLIVVSSDWGGVLAAWDDRLAIIKTGAMTSLMAGSLGGERAAVFYFRDITGIEYNSGFLNGVLEVLTPAYSGGSNHDFWRGSTKSTNADSGNPFTLSNTLPLGKPEWRQAQDVITELRRRIGEAKNPLVHVNVTAPHPPAETHQPVVPTATSSHSSVPPPHAPLSTPGPSGIASELRELAALRDAGILTDEEFAAAKSRLLGG